MIIFLAWQSTSCSDFKYAPYTLTLPKPSRDALLLPWCRSRRWIND